MTAFEYFSVALSFVLGLGVTRLLLGVVHVFRARRQQKVHWMPLTWAVAVFIYQLQYWWAVFELNAALPAWTHLAFITLMLHALLLFVAGTLVLPASAQHDRDDLRDYFDDDGRWALLAMAVYAALSFWTNWSLFGVTPFTGIGAIVTVFVVLSTLGFVTRNRRLLGLLSIAFLTLAVFAYVVFSAASY